MASKYEGLPFKIDERFRGSKRLGDLYLADEDKPDRVRLLTNIGNVVGPDGYRGGLEIIFNYFKEHPRVHGRVGQCIGGESLRRGNNISFRTRDAEGNLEHRIGYKKGAWVGDDHYDFLLKLQAAINLDDGKWTEFLLKERQPKGEYRKKADDASKAYEEELLGDDADDLKARPGMWVFYALGTIRNKIKDPEVAESVTLYETSPMSLEGKAIEHAVDYYVQFYPHKAVGIQSVDNIDFMVEELGGIKGRAKFKPVKVYKGPVEVDESERTIKKALSKDEITLAEVRGLLKAAREQLGMSLATVHHTHNRETIYKYFGDLGAEPWLQYRKAIESLREAVGHDTPIIHARLSEDEKKKEELPGRTRLGKTYRKASEFLEVLDKGIQSGKNEWNTTLSSIPMRLADPYISSAAVELRKAGMRKDEQKA